MANTENERSRSEVLGMKVISIREGLELGQVAQVVIDQAYRVAGFVVKGHRSREERRLALSSVSSFGQDRITVERQDALEQANSFARQGRRMRGNLSLVGARVFTAGGRVLGKVEEYHFCTADGRVTWLTISSGRLKERFRVPGDSVIVISPQTVMIRDAGLEQASVVDGGFRSGLNSARDTVGEAAAALGDLTRRGMQKLSAEIDRRREPRQEAAETREPGMETPETETPEIDTPGMETPEIDTPGMETPNPQTPAWQRPETAEPDTATPEIDKPETEKSIPMSEDSTEAESQPLREGSED